MIIENFLPNSLADKVENLLCSNYFPWRWNQGISYGGDVSFSNKDYQLIHLFTKNGLDQSEYIHFARSLLDWFEHHTGLSIKYIWRIKANLTVRQNYSEYELNSLLHHDLEQKNCLSMIYYVHDTDGDTFIFDNKLNKKAQFSPKKNCAVWFKSNEIHRPSPPKIHGARIIINFVFEVNENID